jgi:TrmH family RNA methyltransferase
VSELTEFPNLSVVLVEPESPGNVGFVARVMANFGVSDLRIVNADPRFDDQAQMFAVRAKDILERAVILPDLKSALEDTDVSWAATARHGGNLSVTRATLPLTELPDPLSLDGRIALVFGRESAGLTNEEVLECDLAFTIPSSKEYPSLNLSHAVAVTLYDIFRRFAPEPVPPETGVEGPSVARAATRAEREQAAIFFDEIVDQINLKEFRRPIAKQVFRNLLGRAYVTGREVTTMTGVLRRMKEKIEDEGQEP